MDMVADKEVADMVAGQWSRVLINWAQTFRPEPYPLAHRSKLCESFSTGVPPVQ